MAERIKALCVREPWASMIADELKTIETRTRTTLYRGPLLIVVSRFGDPPLGGMAICRVNLVGCRAMTIGDEAAACCRVYERAKAWLLEDVRRIEPFRIVRGKLGLFDVEMPEGSEAETTGSELPGLLAER